MVKVNICGIWVKGASEFSVFTFLFFCKSEVMSNIKVKNNNMKLSHMKLIFQLFLICINNVFI